MDSAMFIQTCNVLGSRIRAIEFYLVLRKIKPCIRHLLQPKQFKRICDTADHLGLFWATAEYRIRPAEQPGKGMNKNYTNKGYVVKQGQPGWQDCLKIFYCSKSKNLAEQAAIAEAQQNHRKLGLLLGYPNCCINFFLKHMAEKSLRDFDMADKTIQASKSGEYPWQMNILGRYEDNCIISHFPCKFGCDASQKIGKKSSEEINRISTNFRNELQKNLTQNFDLGQKKIRFA